MGKVLTAQRRDEIQRQIQKTDLNQIIRDFVIDLSPFTVPSPTNRDDEQARMVEVVV